MIDRHDFVGIICAALVAGIVLGLYSGLIS